MKTVEEFDNQIAKLKDQKKKALKKIKEQKQQIKHMYAERIYDTLEKIKGKDITEQDINNVIILIKEKYKNETTEDVAEDEY